MIFWAVRLPGGKYLSRPEADSSWNGVLEHDEPVLYEYEEAAQAANWRRGSTLVPFYLQTVDVCVG